MPPPAPAHLARIVDPAGDPVAIGRAFAAAWARVRAAHPTLRVDEEAFARHVARHKGDDAVKALEGPHVRDLYLALGCGLGEAGALAEFERAHLDEVPAFVAHLNLDRDAIDELLQGLRHRLLAPRDGGAKILDYSGQGPLGAGARREREAHGGDTEPPAERPLPTVVEDLRAPVPRREQAMA